MVFPFVQGTIPTATATATWPTTPPSCWRRCTAASRKTGSNGAVRRIVGTGLWSSADSIRDFDKELDAWEQTRTPPRLPIHGDYYGVNLLTAGDRIVGVIDWAEARLEHQEQEVSWAAWEFCQNDTGDDLALEDAVGFLRRYQEAGGPADVATPFDPIPWIRQRLRVEAASWFHDPSTASRHSEYHEAQLRAFSALRGHTPSG